MTNPTTKKYFIDTEFHEHKKPVKFLGITIAKVWSGLNFPQSLWEKARETP
jgi:hypothetical protein